MTHETLFKSARLHHVHVAVDGVSGKDGARMSLHDVTIPLEKREEIYENKGERHYVWPRQYLENGLRATCESCLYYKPYEKSELYYDGECGSVVQNKRPGYTHRLDGNDRVSRKDCCHLWFWKDEKGGQIMLEDNT